ncbi:hypothetical protein [Glycomyces harbinensis]|uniref:hypothetical protein n=1 Tax=Glycomyces harbinensis TaxID=58114 RepID=UPI001C40A1C0|nr:hypothetical protein [Glycomyces harbinensis]
MVDVQPAGTIDVDVVEVGVPAATGDGAPLGNDRRCGDGSVDCTQRGLRLHFAAWLLRIGAWNLAFRRWALIETLRLSGVRCEELVKLTTHLSVRNYRRPNGEVVALLVISPSKTDLERVVPMSAELFGA